MSRAGCQRGRRPAASSPNVRTNRDKKEVRRHEECIRVREKEMMSQENGNQNKKESLLKKDEEASPETNGRDPCVEQEQGPKPQCRFSVKSDLSRT